MDNWHSGHGGGISNVGTITINRSTISGNSVASFGEGGGGIDNYGTAAINNSTISANSGYLSGGGILNAGAVMISNSTLVGNYIQFDNDGGGGISGTATLQNSIIADNSDGNCSRTLTSDGYHLSSDNTCDFSGPGDLNNTDPKLGPLQNNGGPTQTEALLAGSPAIDAGNPSGCTDSKSYLLKTDRRGKPRPDKEDTGGCDMGAYESQSD